MAMDRASRRGRVRAAIRAAAATALGLLAFADDARSQAGNFTVIAVPDTQFYTCPSGGNCASGLGIFDGQTSWIADQRDELDVAFVTQLGDCTQNGNVIAEWNLADAAFSTLEAEVSAGQPDGIPFGIAVGNHDQFPIANPGSIPNVSDVGNPSQGTTTTTYNGYFGVDRFCPAGVCRSYYGDHFGINNDNHYQLFSANGYHFIVLHIEYMPSDTPLRRAVLAWADDVLEAHPDRRAIVTTHWMLAETGADADFSNQGAAIYQALRHHPRLFLLLGGHVAGEGRRSDSFEGRTVHSLLSDYQGRAMGGSGWLRILEFQPANDAIAVRTYSPYLDAFETDGDSEFTIPYDMQGGHPEAEQAVFQDGVAGYADTGDTFLEAAFPNDGNGGENHLFWDGSPQRHGLLRFANLFDSEGGPIPTGATIVEATLRYVADDDGNPANLHEVVIDWDESTSYATFGVAPAAQPGDDYDPVALGEQASGTAPGAAATVHEVDVTSSVAAWAANPGQNRGWIFVPTGTNGTGIRTREHATTTDRPRLTVEYLAPIVTRCNDGADNDGDGLVDFPADPGCFDGLSPWEDPDCQDGRNNDLQSGADFDGGASLDLDDDGFVDAAFDPTTPAVDAADPQCAGRPWRNSEFPNCGLGGELVVLLPLLGRLRRRRGAGAASEGVLAEGE